MNTPVCAHFFSDVFITLFGHFVMYWSNRVLYLSNNKVLFLHFQECNNWRQVRSFIESIVNSFNIGPDEVRIGLITFANNGNLRWNLNE